MRNIIKNKKLFLAMPPLFKISYKEKNYYAYDEKEKEKILNNFKNEKSLQITRYKGLGEMPAEQLKKTTMDFENRQLIEIDLNTSSKEEKKTEKLFEALMGKKAEHRYKFIQENANFTSNLDI